MNLSGGGGQFGKGMTGNFPLFGGEERLNPRKYRAFYKNKSKIIASI